MRVSSTSHQKRRRRKLSSSKTIVYLKRYLPYGYVAVVSLFLLLMFQSMITLLKLRATLRTLDLYSAYYSTYLNFAMYSDRVFQVWEEYYGKYMDPVEKYLVISQVYDLSVRYNLDPNLVLAIIFVESKGNPRAISVAGAKGLMQLMPSTFNYILKGSTRIYDAKTNVMVGGRFLFDLVKQYRDLDSVLIHYNGGSKALKYLPKETRIYLQRVKITYKIFSSGNFLLIRSFIERTARGEWK